ncbi:hypothetical protein PsorP6_005843 [Peronosclerospora sorghi]|uniref:Uncharacterized protein n=1 Tax=Peronosclerospora sorghi TaxID=230839 RepID=A0ACC0W479_9STRA|nr:hypothetical protein PsorP6_005843 [Peronosclerospora sorghi]
MPEIFHCFSASLLVPTTPIFNRAVTRQQRNNIALFENGEECEYLKDEVARRLIDRLEDIERAFPLVLDLGCSSGHLYKHLSVDDGLGGIKKLVQCDSAEKLLHRDDLEMNTRFKCSTRLVVDEDFLPFPSRQFDLVMSSLSLHWVNDLESTFRHVLDTLKPDGAFRWYGVWRRLIARAAGSDCCFNWTKTFILADQERQGGNSSLISPFMNIADAGNLLSTTGFHLCTGASDGVPAQTLITLTLLCGHSGHGQYPVNHPNAFVLMEILKVMGEFNAINSRRAVTRDSLLATASVYQSMYGLPDGTVPATFPVIFFIRLSPYHSHQKPLRRGSAQD